MIIVSYGTDQFPHFYEKAVINLARDCRNHKLKYDFTIFPHRNLKENVLRKPTFILDMLEYHKQPLLWIDADSRITKRIEINFEEDLILFPKQDYNGFSGGIVGYNNTDKCKELLECWEYYCRYYDSMFGDHVRLRWAINDIKPTIQWAENKWVEINPYKLHWWMKRLYFAPRRILRSIYGDKI